LLNSAHFVVDYLNTIHGIDAKMESVVDANQVDRVITEYDPLFVFIEALWITPEKLKEIMMLKRHQKRIFIIRIHSRPTFLANEGVAFKWLLGYRELKFKNLLIAPNHEEFARDLKTSFALQSIYLPNIYNPPEYEKQNNSDNLDKDLIKIGCFGSLRPMKNHLAQAIAAVRFAKNNNKRLEFHINSTRMEQHGDQVLHNLISFFDGQNTSYNLVKHDWLSHEEFVTLVRQMDVGMQVSLSETFNIIAADFVYNNIPILGSKQVSWLPERFQVQDPNSTDEISEMLEHVWGFFGGFFRRSSNKSLNKYNNVSKKIWNQFISF
jgi:hypothetical protein